MNKNTFFKDWTIEWVQLFESNIWIRSILLKFNVLATFWAMKQFFSEIREKIQCKLQDKQELW